MARGGHRRHIPESVKVILVTNIDPVYLAVVYATNKHMAGLEWEPSCSIVSQFAVRAVKLLLDLSDDL